MAARRTGVGVPGVTGIPYLHQKLVNAEIAHQGRMADIARARYEGSHVIRTERGGQYRVDIRVEGPSPRDWVNNVGSL